MEKSLARPEYRLFLAQLRNARKAAGLSQTELAARLQRTQSFVSKVERGERRLDVIELRAFCEALRLSLPLFMKRLEKTVRTSNIRTCEK